MDNIDNRALLVVLQNVRQIPRLRSEDGAYIPRHKPRLTSVLDHAHGPELPVLKNSQPAHLGLPSSTGTVTKPYPWR